VPEGGRFLKGLAVVDDVAFFGMSVWSDRAARGDPAHDSQLAAFCLRGMALLWRHEVGCVSSPPCHTLLACQAWHFSDKRVHWDKESQLAAFCLHGAAVAARGDSSQGFQLRVNLNSQMKRVYWEQESWRRFPVRAC